MSISDALSVASLALGTAAIVIAVAIYVRQTRQSEIQYKRATALANLELLEKFGTISSRAERLEEIRLKTSADLQLGPHLTASRKEHIREWRAQIMYLIYDCLAVNEAYKYAALETQQQFREIMFGYNNVWKDIPMIHRDRAGLGAVDAENLLTFFSEHLQAYCTDSKLPELSAQLTAHSTRI